MQVAEPLHLCPECYVIKTPRSKHCSVCNKCVERYDHHCPWINNCIGVKNHNLFISFISTLVCSILWNFGCTLKLLIEIMRNTDSIDLINNELFYSIPTAFTQL